MDSRNSLFQNNVLNTRRWETSQNLQFAVVTCAERTYRRKRRQGALGKMTPTEFESLDSALKADYSYELRARPETTAIPMFVNVASTAAGIFSFEMQKSGRCIGCIGRAMK